VVGRALFSLRVVHEAPLPDPPFVVAANHYSHFDPPVISGALDMPIRFLALEDLFGANVLLDWLIEGYGAIPTPRFRLPITAVKTALSVLAGGEAVGVFPEATRVSHWGTLPPKRGAGWLAARAGVPLIPVAVVGTGRAFGLDNRLRRAKTAVVVGPALGMGSAESLTSSWSEWMTSTISRYPGSEVKGPRRSLYP
jgi:1-acyl-sn-glycerol-3-phosphate acyltransferase